tara:strand:- start:401 stop:2029 length:1629 start_codon:yes stop_codon:yes gene_type:complete
MHIVSTSSETGLLIQSNLGGTGSAIGGQVKLALGARNNSGSGQADTQSGDVLGQIMFEGQGTDYSYQGGNIKTIVTTGDGSDNRSNQATAMTFETIAVGSVSPAERLRITASGFVGIQTVDNSGDYTQHTISAPLHILQKTASQGYGLAVQGNSNSQGGRIGIGEADSNFSTRANVIDIGFDSSTDFIYSRTGKDFIFGVNSDERMRIASDGRVAIKSTSLPADFGGERGHLCISSTDNAGANNYAILQLQGHTINNDGSLGAIHFYDHSSSNCSIQANRQNNSGSGKLMFATSESGGSKVTRMTIYDGGHIWMHGNVASGYATAIQNDGDDSDRYGLNIICGKDDGSATNTAIRFADGDDTEVGKITFSGGTVTYGAFTAHHPCSIPDADNNSESSENAYPYGTLLETTSLSYTQKNGADTERGIRYNVRKSQSANSKKVLGAYGSCMNGTELDSEGNVMAQTDNLHQALVLGDGHIICNNEGGNIKVGDGICTSSAEGIGMKATTNPSMVIGIAQEDVSFSGSETKLVAVQYGLQQFTPW